MYILTLENMSRPIIYSFYKSFPNPEPNTKDISSYQCLTDWCNIRLLVLKDLLIKIWALILIAKNIRRKNPKLRSLGVDNYENLVFLKLNEKFLWFNNEIILT